MVHFFVNFTWLKMYFVRGRIRVGNSLFCSFTLHSFALVTLWKRVTRVNCSRRSISKERQEQFAHISFYLKSNESYLLLSLFLKEWQEQNERITLFTFSNTRAICSSFKSGLCSFLREKREKAGLKTYISNFLALLFIKKTKESKLLSLLFTKRVNKSDSLF